MRHVLQETVIYRLSGTFGLHLSNASLDWHWLSTIKITVLGHREDTCTEAPSVPDLRGQDQSMHWPGSSGLVPWQEVVLGEMRRIGMSGVVVQFFYPSEPWRVPSVHHFKRLLTGPYMWFYLLWSQPVLQRTGQQLEFRSDG